MGKNNAITVLTRGYNNPLFYNKLISRNESIWEKIILNSEERFDIIIFHEGNITEEHQLYISSKTPKMDIKFINVKEYGNKSAFNNDKNKINPTLCPPTPQSSSFPLGYKHMCHFWSIDFIDYLKEYKYVIRIDEDCIVDKFDNNVLKQMRDKNIFFTSPYFQGQDEWYVIVGLENLWTEFVKIHNIKPFKNFNQITCPYTNFMILDLEFISNNETIKKILHKIDLSHGIYSNRWGDLPIWGMIITTLFDEKKYWENKLISYHHGSHNKKINY